MDPYLCQAGIGRLMLITFANSLDPDQDRQKVLDTQICSWKSNLKKSALGKKPADNKKFCLELLIYTIQTQKEYRLADWHFVLYVKTSIGLEICPVCSVGIIIAASHSEAGWSFQNTLTWHLTLYMLGSFAILFLVCWFFQNQLF